MGLTDTVGGAIDTAAGALGGGGGAAAKPAPGKPTYKRADALDPPKEKKAVPVGPNGDNTPANGVLPPDVTEFVHYGHVHDDTTDHYAHPNFDNEEGKKPAGRGILFRDAVEREALLLHGFVTGTKTIHEELKKNRGVAGELAGAVGSLVGSSGKEPDPGALKSLLDDITSAGGKINAASCSYVNIHKAGIDLHQTRADYVGFCKDKLDGYYLQKQDSGTALLTAIPAVAGTAKTVFGILFKAFDIYFGTYLRLRAEYEPAIEKACYKFSIDVVKGYKTHSFAPWYPPQKKKEDKKDDASTLPGFLGDAADTVEEKKQDVVDVLGEIEAKEPAPGEGAISDIFAIMGSGPSDDDKKDSSNGSPPKADPGKAVPAPKPADALVIDGFNKVLGTTIPGFLAKSIGKMVWANVDFLKAVYLRLCQDSSKKIDEAWLNETAHTLIFSKLYSFIEDNISFIKSVEDAGVNVQGQKLGPGKQIEKGKEALAQKLGGYADPVIKLAVGKLAEKIEKLRADADKNKSLTMEVFLGQLPFLLAFQVRNTTFPVWDLLITDLLGKGNLALDTAMKPVRGFIGDVKNVVDDVKDKKDRVSAAKDKWDREGLAADNQGQNLTGYKDILFGDKPKGPGANGSGGGSFPGGARTTAGKSEKIPSGDLDKAKGDRKSPWPT
jgi:hypothetical protein